MEGSAGHATAAATPASKHVSRIATPGPQTPPSPPPPPPFSCSPAAARSPLEWASPFTQLGNTLLADCCQLASVVRKHPLFVKLIEKKQELTSAEKVRCWRSATRRRRQGLPTDKELKQRAQKRKEMG